MTTGNATIKARIEVKPIGLSRDANHIYTINYPPALPAIVPGVTGILKVLDKPAIVPWAQGVVADAAIRNRDKLAEWVEVGGVEGATKLLKNAAETQRDAAANRGSQVHALAEAIVKGQPVTIPEELAPYVESYRDWIQTFEPKFLAVEEMVASLDYGYAGTLDSIAVIAGETWLLDIKTSKGYYPETAQQLAAYGHAEFIGRPGDPTQYAIPPIDQYGVVHVRPEGAELIPYDVTDIEFAAFLAAKKQHQWKANRAGRVIGQAIGPALLQFQNPQKEAIAS
jgi:hypothetical protein